MLDVIPALLLVTGVIFLVLLILLNKTLYKPLLGFMDNREKSIKRDLDNAGKNSDEVVAFKKEAEKIILEAKTEANRVKDSVLMAVKDEALKKLDYAIAGVHSHLNMSKREMTERIIRAMKNPYINIISHPTGRILKRREEYQIDFNKILRAAKETKTVLEINSQPERFDLSDTNIRLAKKQGVKMVINTDSHHKDHLRYMELGISQARRGWAEKRDIINCWSCKKVLKLFNEKSKRI